MKDNVVSGISAVVYVDNVQGATHNRWTQQLSSVPANQASVQSQRKLQGERQLGTPGLKTGRSPQVTTQGGKRPPEGPVSPSTSRDHASLNRQSTSERINHEG